MLNRSAGAMAVAMALCVFLGVILLGGVNPYLATPVVTLTVLLTAWVIFLVPFAEDRSRLSWRFASAICLFVVYATVRYFSSVPEYSSPKIRQNLLMR